VNTPGHVQSLTPVESFGGKLAPSEYSRLGKCLGTPIKLSFLTLVPTVFINGHTVGENAQTDECLVHFFE